MDIGDDLIDQIFDVMIRDFSGFAVEIHTKPSSTDKQKQLALLMINAPVPDPERFVRIWEKDVYALKDQYKMRDEA